MQVFEYYLHQMYNSDVKFKKKTPWKYEKVSCKMSLFHYRESIVTVHEKMFKQFFNHSL